MKRILLISRRQKIKRYLATIFIITITLIVTTTLIIIGYKLDWTGFNGSNKSGKTLWDWLQLLIIPLVIAVGGYLFNLALRRNEQQNTTDTQRETALESYIDKMSELLLDQNLRESKSNTEVRDIARAKTISVLQRLDGIRKGNVLKFLYETGLIKGENSIIDLSGADLDELDMLPGFTSQKHIIWLLNLSGINLQIAHLEKAILTGINLSEAKLLGANLCEANLYRTNLSKADLRDSVLIRADLTWANLTEANLTDAKLWGAELTGAKLEGAILDNAIMSDAHISKEQWDKAKSLTGAVMPDGSIHP